MLICIISRVNIIMLHVDIIYLACWGQKYATIANRSERRRMNDYLTYCINCINCNWSVLTISDIAHHDTVFPSHKINWCPFKASSWRVYVIISRRCLQNDSLHVTFHIFFVSLGDVMSEINVLMEWNFTIFLKSILCFSSK